MRIAALVIAATVAVVGGCGESTSPLVVRVRTDYVPGVEFTAVEARLVDRGRFATDSALPTDDFLAGEEVARFEGLADGDYEVTVSLTGLRGALIAGRRVRVGQRGPTEVTVVMTRSCDAVVCAETESCLAGRCVGVECVTGTEAGCPADECTAAGECETPAAACATVGCVDGVCLTSVAASDCADGMYCSPETGCVLLPDGGGECGNGAVDLTEDCDDGNVAEGDGCSATCALEDQGTGGQTCGDAVLLRLVPTAGGRLGATAIGDSAGGFNSASGSCETGGEEDDVIYELRLETDSQVTIAMEPLTAGQNPYVHVRGLGGAVCADPTGEAGCSDGEKGGGTEVITTALLAGRYFVVADSLDGGGPYRLTVSVDPTP